LVLIKKYYLSSISGQPDVVLQHIQDVHNLLPHGSANGQSGSKHNMQKAQSRR